jgi:hypothetical protein
VSFVHGLIEELPVILEELQEVMSSYFHESRRVCISFNERNETIEIGVRGKKTIRDGV